MHVALSYPLIGHYNSRAAVAAPFGWVQCDQPGGEKLCVNRNMHVHHYKMNSTAMMEITITTSLYGHQLHTVVWVNFMLKK